MEDLFNLAAEIATITDEKSVNGIHVYMSAWGDKISYCIQNGSSSVEIQQTTSEEIYSPKENDWVDVEGEFYHYFDHSDFYDDYKKLSPRQCKSQLLELSKILLAFT